MEQSKEITIWKQFYKIVFKDEDTQDKLITPEQFDKIKSKLFKNEWVEVDQELYNPFEIRKIIKFKIQDWITQRLSKESEKIQREVREFMRVYKKEINLWVLENMIKKAKGIEI